jgi:mannose-1-phosphate guanylyltransferase / phosphomannomutase
MIFDMQLVIIAGGKGTRLGDIRVPKPMVKVGGKPLLEHQIELARRYGLTEIIILVGYRSDQIIDYFGNGSNWQVNISYSVEEKPLGTAGSLKLIEGQINGRFMVFYGDTMMDINLKKLVEYDSLSSSIGTLLCHPNDHPYDSDIIEINEDSNEIIWFHSKPHNNNVFKPNLVNAALYILSNEIFDYIESDKKSDFGKDIFPRIIQAGSKLIAYNTAEYIKDMGTPDRLEKVEGDFLSKKVKLLNSENKRKAIFIDRDGVINKEVDNLRSVDEFELINDVPEALGMINNSNYLAIVITNQPVVAKGWCSFEELNKIHNKMHTELGYHNVFLDRVYYCPHHPEYGFDGEIKELKIDCYCRKPKIGLIEKAVSDYNIDLDGSYFIGDTTTDIKTAYNAGIVPVLVKTGFGGEDKKFNVNTSYVFDNLLSAVKKILEMQKLRKNETIGGKN